MSNYDGTGEKQRDGGDSGAFRGRRHPFLERRIDWKSIERKMGYGSEAFDSSALDKLGLPREVSPFQLFSGPDARSQRVDNCVNAIKQLSTDSQKWYVVRDCLIQEYRGAGNDPAAAQRAVVSFIGSVNQRLGQQGEINYEQLTGEAADQTAAAEGLANPNLVLSIRIWHAAGLFGPIGVAFAVGA